MHSTNVPEPLDVELAEPLLTRQRVARLPAIPRSSVFEYARRLRRPLPSSRGLARRAARRAR